MANPGLIAYFLVSYSIGLASLAVSLASCLKRRSRVARDFFLATLVMATIGASSMVMNLLDAGSAPWLFSALSMLNHTCAAAFIVVQPLLVHSAYRTPRARAISRRSHPLVQLSLPPSWLFSFAPRTRSA